MRNVIARTALLAAAACLLAACATSPPTEGLLAQEPPWWESAGPCRIWVPVTPLPGRAPVWDPTPSTSRISRTGDCRALNAALPDGAVLIGAN